MKSTNDQFLSRTGWPHDHHRFCHCQSGLPRKHSRAAVFSTQSTIDEGTIAPLVSGNAATLAGPADPIEEYLKLDFRAARDHFERAYLPGALELNRGNITATAAAIGMSQSNLSRKLKELGIRDGQS